MICVPATVGISTVMIAAQLPWATEMKNTKEATTNFSAILLLGWLSKVTLKG